LHIQTSRHVTVQSVYIKGDWEVFNNDGVDIDSSSDVSVLDSTIDTADNALCVKSMLEGVPVERVLGRN
jgi:polygalacturonase